MAFQVRRPCSCEQHGTSRLCVMWDLVEPEDIWQGAPALHVTHYTEHASFMPESCGASYIATLETVG